MKRKKRILFGAVDIGYRIELYSKFISRYLPDHFSAESFTKYKLPESHYKTSYNFLCEVDKHSKWYVYIYTFCFFIYSLFRYDVFHFFSGETILTRRLRRFEFIIYKLLGKRLVMHFVGSDIRSPDYLFWKNENLESFLKGDMPAFYTESWQDKLIMDSSKYADYILVSTPDLLKIIPKARYYPVVIDFYKFYSEVGDFESSDVHIHLKEKITILHAPSNDKIKGTRHIHAALNSILSRFGDKVELITPWDEYRKSGNQYSVSRYELFKMMQISDVLIDQLVIGWYGLQSLEGLLSGCIVMTYIEEGLEGYLFKDCPIVNVNAETLESVLEQVIIRNIDSKSNIKERNIAWVKEYHTIENNHKELLLAWGGDVKIKS